MNINRNGLLSNPRSRFPNKPQSNSSMIAETIPIRLSRQGGHRQHIGRAVTQGLSIRVHTNPAGSKCNPGRGAISAQSSRQEAHNRRWESEQTGSVQLLFWVPTKLRPNMNPIPSCALMLRSPNRAPKRHTETTSHFGRWQT